jgi:hypothetical protein
MIRKVSQRFRRGKELSTKVLWAVTALGGILVAARVSAAQHNIVISDSLAANADTLTVKKGAQWLGRMPKWRLGDYAVASSKMSSTATRTAGNLSGTSEMRSSGKFSFVLTNGTGDSASVQAEHNMTVHSLHKESEHGWSIASDEVTLDSQNATAHITINGDTTDTWALVLGVRVAHRSELISNAVLTNGVRKIVLSDVTSVRHGRFDLRGTAAGYEFIEDGRSLGALQYRGGTLGMTNIVWMLRSVDARTKLLLAAAMTAILQVKSPEPGP